MAGWGDLYIYTPSWFLREKKQVTAWKSWSESSRERGEKNKKSLRVVEADQGWQQSKPGALQKPELAVTKFAVKH